MAYASIAKLEKFTGKENDAQVWLNDMKKTITANRWDNARAILVNKPQDFNTFKLAIQADYFIAPQILNQFIRGLHSSILQCMCPIHPADLQAAVTNARDFEATELEANHVQVINLETHACHYCGKQRHLQFEYHKWLNEQRSGHQYQNFDCQLQTQNYVSNQLPELYQLNYLLMILHLLISPEDAQSNNLETNQQPTLTSNIPPAIITENKLLDVIFPFELEELLTMLLFSGTTLEKKPITAMYTDAKADSHFIKLILDSKSAGSIITRQLINQLGYKSTKTEHPQKYIKVATIGTIGKDHFSYRKALFQYFRKDLGIPAETAYVESDFCNYINAKIDCLLGCATDIGRLEKQIHQSLLGYSIATTTRAIAETLHIIDTDIKYYMAQQFPQVQQPVESNPEEYKNKSNNPITVQQTKSNILPVTITENTILATIFPFDIDNLNTHSLFSGAVNKQDKPITALYTNAKVRKIDIKLILNSRSASSIITKQLIDQLSCRVDHAATIWIITVDGNTKTPIGEINNFPFEINEIQILTKILIMEATQYQALVENNWLSKANTTLD
ncbi:hypothetical protein G9A89_016427 [Geosiphon pyriformis]|nr:hypothetical protein G9A89_016427 [Geosiphon pyriformis]